MAFGELKIVPSADIGELGPKEGTAVVYNWRWYYSAPGLLLWLVLILVLVLPKSNHDRRVLLILVPLVFVNLLWLLFKKVSGMSSSDAQQFDILFQSMAIGIAVLWLIVHKFGGSNGFVRFCLSLGILAVVAGLGTLSYCTGFSGETAICLVLLVFMSIVLLLALAVAGSLCKRQYLPVRYMLWLGLCTLFGSVAAMLGFFIVGTLFIFPGQAKLASVIFEVAGVGLALGVCLYVLNLPYMILAFYSPFFRERFYMCLRLKSIPTTPGQTDVARLGVQSQDRFESRDV